jgi:hypothetical protein
MPAINARAEALLADYDHLDAALVAEATSGSGSSTVSDGSDGSRISLSPPWGWRRW